MSNPRAHALSRNERQQCARVALKIRRAKKEAARQQAKVA